MWRGVNSPPSLFIMTEKRFEKDQTGRELNKHYSTTLLVDPAFERKLQAFDPDLKLIFDQTKKRWVILQWTGDPYNWAHIMTLEDEHGNPLPFSDMILNKLYVWRHRAEVRNQDPMKWFRGLTAEAERQKDEIDSRVSQDNQYRLKNDILQWRKAARELQGMPGNDITAGFANVTVDKRPLGSTRHVIKEMEKGRESPNPSSKPNA